MFPLDVSKFSELYTGDQLLTYLLMSLLNAIIILLSSMKFILVLQQCNYRGKRYFKWLSHKDTPYMSRLMLLCMMALFFFCVLNMTFVSMLGNAFASYFGLCSYILFAIMYINTEKNINAKIPLKKTKRLVRLCITYALLLFAFSFAMLLLLDYLAFCFNVWAYNTSKLYRLCYWQRSFCNFKALFPLFVAIANTNNTIYRIFNKRTA